MTGEAAAAVGSPTAAASPTGAAGRPHHVVVMGVSGCGKSTVGGALAAAIGAQFLDGDSLHPQANIDKMASGIPLNDDDRAPWLAAIGDRFAQAPGTGQGSTGLVIACSALKRAYRDIIRSRDAGVVFLYLYGSREVLNERVNSRPGHFMPPSLLDSQLATLETPQPDEAAFTVDIADPVETIVAQAQAWLGSRSGAAAA